MAILLAACVTLARVSFHRDVCAILESNCFAGHTPSQGVGYLKSGLNMETCGSLIQGHYYGPVVMPGDSRQSILNMLVEERADSSMRLPPDRDRPLTDREIDVPRRWVDQGARDTQEPIFSLQGTKKRSNL